MTADPIADLVSHVVQRHYEDLPAPAIGAAKRLLLDTLGNGVAGATTPGATAIRSAVATASSGAPAQLWGRADTLPAHAAALVNAYQIHCLEYDCVHETAVLHPLTPLVAAMLADAERLKNISGREFLTALILGVDVACNIALASTVASPFFRTGSTAAFGATAACARLRGLPPAAVLSALGLAYEQMGSSRQAHTEGTSIMGLLAGFAARNALAACDLAEHGVVGPVDVLAGPYGYLNLYEGSYDLSPWQTLGVHYQITAVSQKPYPCGRPIHLAVDAVRALIGKHGIGAADVVSGVCRMPPTVHALVGRPFVDDATPNYLKLCTPYCIACALLGGTLSQADFTPATIGRREVAKLARLITVQADDNPDPNAISPATLTLTLANGAVVEQTIDKALGHPDNPLSRAQRLEKFWSCWNLAEAGPGEARGTALLAQIDTLETLEHVGELSELLRTTP